MVFNIYAGLSTKKNILFLRGQVKSFCCHYRQKLWITFTGEVVDNLWITLWISGLNIVYADTLGLWITYR